MFSLDFLYWMGIVNICNDKMWIKIEVRVMDSNKKVIETERLFL